MLVGMLVFMLYRWEHYTSGYSFASWPPRRHGTGGLEHHLPKQGSRPPGQEWVDRRDAFPDPRPVALGHHARPYAGLMDHDIRWMDAGDQTTSGT